MTQDQDDDPGFNDAFEAVAMARIRCEIAPIFLRHGHGLVEKSSIEIAERQRVAAIIARDQRDRAREQDRKLAEIEVRGGVFVNLASTVIEPTPEWLIKGEVRSFTPKQPDDTVRVIKSVRRVLTPIVGRMWKAGKLSDEHLKSCLWYRQMHEKAGMEGRYSGSRYGDACALNVAKLTRFSGASGHIPMTIDEAYARQMSRLARTAINPSVLRFFDAIVLEDVPLRRAARFVRCRAGGAKEKFRKAVMDLTFFCENEKVDLLGIERY